VKLTIDNRVAEIRGKATILQAAEAHDIYIPHLCSHAELTPYGGCRLCIVEVDGMRGYPTACTTLVEEGMVVRTQSKTLNEMRREILQLILSEHPAACLICDEAKECLDYQQTIRKVGITTGCRWCPKDEDCELQKVVKSLEIREITFPVYFREIPVETDDPFFDHDYNLCIYCGRCVRICQELRRSSVIAFRKRGRLTTIGPAFGRSHLEANCEFCGACLSVCPTGSLAEKERKWHGVAKEFMNSVCPLCSLNCDIQIAHNGNKIIGTLPPGDPHQSGGELCVKGRFCLSAWVNHPQRIQAPQFHFPEGLGVISWDEAVRKAGAILKNVPAGRAAVYLSPDLTLEEIAAAKFFFQRACPSAHITSSVLTQKLTAFLSLSLHGITLREMEDSDLLISIFVNGNFNYAPLTLAIKRLAEKGVPYMQIGWLADTTSRFAFQRHMPPPGRERPFFDAIARSLSGGTARSADIQSIAAALKAAAAPVIILSAELLNLSSAEAIMPAIERIMALTGARLLTVHPYGNLAGLLSLIPVEVNEAVSRLVGDHAIDILYLVADGPFATRPAVKSIIYQGVFPPADNLAADLILPSATFGEIAGSYYDCAGARKKFSPAVHPPEMALPHQEIYSRIAATMGKPDAEFDAAEISRRIPEKANITLPACRKGRGTTRKATQKRAKAGFMLLQEESPHYYHDASLSGIIAGMSAIAPEDTLIMNPDDAERMGIAKGDRVAIRSSGEESSFPVDTRKSIPTGFVYLQPSIKAFMGMENPRPVEIVPITDAEAKRPPPGRSHV
jgi:NADH dehydrogenase/NADH:ubiquinone oxidoreductase subunit G